MKRRWLAAALIVMIVALMSYGTSAYFSVNRRAVNVITTGNISLQLLNELPGQGNRPILFMPGDRMANTVMVTNTGDHPAFIRVAVTPAIEDGSFVPRGSIDANIDPSQWTHQNGYWYFNRPLEARETALVFSEIYFNGAVIDNAYLGKILTLDVTVYGVQSENNGTDPLSAMGWPG